jgi:hypothetical protein
VLRGGIGFGSVSFSDKSGNVKTSVTENGLGLMAGVGYEFRVKRTVAIGPQLNWNQASTDSFTADWYDGEVAFTWYFLPKP